MGPALLTATFLSACGWFGEPNPYTASEVGSVTYSTDRFAWRPARIAVGTVYRGRISNRDRSYAKDIWLRIAADRIESFKVYPGADRTFLVTATIDKTLYSISHIAQVEIDSDLRRHDTIEMSLAEDPAAGYRFGDLDVPSGHFPVTNHGFDFSDLNFVFRNLTDPENDLSVGVISPVDGGIAYTGLLEFTYSGRVPCGGESCYRYELGGNGVNDGTGHALVHPTAGYFVHFELDANYHPRFDYFRYELQGVSALTEKEWDALIERESRAHFR
jgi:hypothetical protein